MTWFVASAITDAVGSGSLDLQAGTGLLAIAVLLVVMNWFFHKVYWTGWISHLNRRRKELVADGPSAGVRRTLLGFGLLMVGESVQELHQPGWIGTTPLGVSVPGWMSHWFSTIANLETILAQMVAAVLMIGSYVLAEELKVRRPRRRGQRVAARALAPPVRAPHPQS